MRNLQEPMDLGGDALCDFMVGSREEEERLWNGRRKRWSAASSKEQVALPFFLAF